MASARSWRARDQTSNMARHRGSVRCCACRVGGREVLRGPEIQRARHTGGGGGANECQVRQGGKSVERKTRK
ncbi:hypothetical protein CPB85DRAFT_375036 [Mucidula mucida]|nr:hypothetical protein CPB85DRAFT_375036 [Mucidula mucida]